jgi:hypothetical protein
VSLLFLFGLLHPACTNECVVLRLFSNGDYKRFNHEARKSPSYRPPAAAFSKIEVVNDPLSILPVTVNPHVNTPAPNGKI